MASAGLTPDTPYTRARFRTLYGSTERAAVPAAVVRARTVPDANANYSDFVRSEPCRAGRFQFDGLPDGDYAVRAFHDLNGDGKMNTNPFGMPTEPYAFSNNAVGNMGPASWDRAKFAAAGATAQTIDLK